jgi:hypothetical protein
MDQQCLPCLPHDGESPALPQDWESDVQPNDALAYSVRRSVTSRYSSFTYTGASRMPILLRYTSRSDPCLSILVLVSSIHLACHTTEKALLSLKIGKAKCTSMCFVSPPLGLRSYRAAPRTSRLGPRNQRAPRKQNRTGIVVRLVESSLAWFKKERKKESSIAAKAAGKYSHGLKNSSDTSGRCIT